VSDRDGLGGVGRRNRLLLLLLALAMGGVGGCVAGSLVLLVTRGLRQPAGETGGTVKAAAQQTESSEAMVSHGAWPLGVCIQHRVRVIRGDRLLLVRGAADGEQRGHL
jgi:hypothetical protein